MSHVTKVEGETRDQQITDLRAFKAAVGRCHPDLEFKEGQRHFKTWADDNGGQLVGDYPLPAGVANIGELQGLCRHAVGIKQAARGNKPYADYEVGLIESQKFPGTYSLALDFWSNSLSEMVGGNKCGKLMMNYHVEAVKNLARARGHTAVEERLPDGRVKLVVNTPQTIAAYR